MRSSVIAALWFGFAGSAVRAEAAAGELPERVGKPEGEIVVNVKADGSVHVGDKQLTLEAFKEEFAKLAKQNKDRPVRIRGDATVEYLRIVAVLDACQKAGLHGSSYSAKQAAVRGFEHGECEDKLVAVADVAPDLDCEFFRTSETGLQPWIVEHDGGTLEDTMDGTIDAEDLLLVEKTADCISTHQGEHAMGFCDAVKTADGVELSIWGGAPAYMSSLTVTIDAKRQFVCRFKATYPSASAPLRWKVTKKAMKLTTAPGEPGSRLRGWISVEFDEIDDMQGSSRSHKVEGCFKPVIQSAPVAGADDD